MCRMKRILLTTLFCGLLAPAFAGDIADIVKSGEIWKKNRQQLSAGALNGVRYAPVDADTIRVPRNGGIQLSELDFGEAVISWQPNKGPTQSVVIMVYNKGDDSAIDRESYMETLQQTITALNELMQTKGKSRKASKKDTGVSLQSWVWETEGSYVRLDASYTGRKKDFSPEFIRLKMGPDKDSVVGGGADDTAKRNDLKANVQRDEESGDVWISIPMVDQGQKGYCVPATVARVFAYYGMDGVDQHALAQLCDSSGDDGTSYAAMQEALESISRKFHIRMQMLDGKDIRSTYMEYIADYNKAAKKLKKQQATPMDWIEVCRDRQVLLAARGNKKYVKKWFSAIKKSLDVGVPILWSVELGIFPEAGIPQAGGGHMRLIVGYNEEDGTIYYSDSWGAGHEKKAMKMNQAAAITRYRYILRPSR